MLDFMTELLNKFEKMLCDVLPTSPFDQYIAAFADLPYMGYINWFLPVGSCLVIFLAWLGCVTLFYVYSIIMRWVKMIGD